MTDRITNMNFCFFKGAKERYNWGDIFYNRESKTADIYLKNLPEAAARFWVENGVGWYVKVKAMSYKIIAALRYPSSEGIVVLTIDHADSIFDPAPVPECKPRGGMCVAAEREDRAEVPTRVCGDGYGGGVVWDHKGL